MEEHQEQKCYVCKFCKQSFSNGRKLGGHMRRHLGLIAASKKQSIEEHDQEVINGGLGLEFDEDYGANSYGLRENPKKSWRVSNSKRISNSVCEQCGKEFNSLRALGSHMKSHTLKNKESIKKILCKKCGKGFDSVKAMYGHMRCHTIKKSQPSVESSSSSSSSSWEDQKLGGEVKREIANPIRKKRSCTKYKPVKRNNITNCTSLSSFASVGEASDDEVEQGAVCLMMLSMGARDMDGAKMVISHDRGGMVNSSHHEVNVSVDGSIGFSGFKQDVNGESGWGQNDMDILKNNARSNGQHFGHKGKRKACDDECDTHLRRSKDHRCLICFKEFGSGQALGGHKKAHYNLLTNTEKEISNFFDIHGLFNLEGEIKNGDVELKVT